MHDNFDSLVSVVLGDFLAEHRFERVSIQDTEGGSLAEVIYESKDCKLRFYDSLRGGEVNCLIGSIAARNDSQHSNPESGGWFYIRDVLDIGKGLSFEELRRQMPPPVSGKEAQLVQLRDLLVPGFDMALANLRARIAR